MSDEPVTIGDLRAHGKRLHVLCRGCGWEREPHLDEGSFASVPDSTTLAEVRTKLKCKMCGERQKIWVAAEYADADAQSRREWGWTWPEIEAAKAAQQAAGA